MEVSLFPTYFWKLKVSNHKSIKERYLQSFIDGYENNIYDIPEGWVTHKCHTSFSESKLMDRDICDEYASIIYSIFNKNGQVILNVGIKYIKTMSTKSGTIICHLHYLLYIF